MQRFVRNDVLENLPLLAVFPQPALKELLDRAPILPYRKGAILFKEGDPCDNVYRIISGRCETYQVLADGSLKHPAILGPGDYIGEPDFSGQKHHNIFARVITDSVLQQISCAELRALLKLNSRSIAPVPDNGPAVDVIDEFPAQHSGRIIVTFSFSKTLPNRSIVEKLASSLFSETAESILLLRIVSTSHHSSSNGYPALAEMIDSDFHFRDQMPQASGEIARLSVKIGQAIPTRPGTLRRF